MNATGQTHPFRVPPLLRRMLLEGLDEIALARARQPAIDASGPRAPERPPVGLPLNES